MLQVIFDKKEHIAVLEPDGPLTEGDLLLIANTIDPDIAAHGRLNGIVVHSRSFPGWNSTAAMISQFRFLRDHRRTFSRVALATDSLGASIAKVFAKPFLQAEIRAFPYEALTKATHWVAGEPVH